MPQSPDNIETLLLEMRCRVLSLAADLDRLQRQGLKDHPRLSALRQAIGVLQRDSTNRAAEVQMLFSDITPPPKRNS